MYLWRWREEDLVYYKFVDNLLGYFYLCFNGVTIEDESLFVDEGATRSETVTEEFSSFEYDYDIL